MLEFVKYQGTGNDFIMIDDRNMVFDRLDEKRVALLCHRRFGIGADGLILIRNQAGADFEMVYFNSDGKPASLCGNGSRCAVHFARSLGLIEREARFLTSEGMLYAFIDEDLVHIRMPDVDGINILEDGYFLNTGSPHHICFVNQGLDTLDVYRDGRAIRYSEPYKKEGSNVNFVQQIDKNSLFVRTYERGVENETLSCGTGVTAAALVYALKEGSSPVAISTMGGELRISFEKVAADRFVNVFLIGPATKVFSGSTQL